MAQPKVFKVVGGKRVPDDYQPERGHAMRYRFVVDVGEDPQTGKRKQLTRTFDRKREAEAELSKVLNEVNSGTHVVPAKITVNEYLDEWLRSATRGKEKSTQNNLRDLLLPVRAKYGEKPLKKLTMQNVEDLVDFMLTSGRKRGGQAGTPLSPATVGRTLGRLRAALDQAVLRKIISVNPATYVKVGVKRTRNRPTPWSPEEVKKFLFAIGGLRWFAPMLLSCCGLRPAEVCGLKWDRDVDLDAQVIRIQETRTLVEYQPVVKDTKTRAGNRTLPLPAPVAEALRRFRTIQSKERLKLGEGYINSGYVVVHEDGRPFRTDELRRLAHKMMAAAGVRRVRLYDARHACLTYLRMNGVPGPIVSAWAGHEDLSVADRVYVHPSVEDLRQGADALTKLLG